MSPPTQCVSEDLLRRGEEELFPKSSSFHCLQNSLDTTQRLIDQIVDAVDPATEQDKNK